MKLNQELGAGPGVPMFEQALQCANPESVPRTFDLCGGLNETVPHRLTYSDICAPLVAMFEGVTRGCGLAGGRASVEAGFESL